MSKSITIPYSAEGFERAAKWVENYANRNLPKGAVELISRMCRTGEVWAMTLMDHIDTGNTLSTIHGYRNGNNGVIVANGAAIWIEFGTGVYADGQTDHPLLGRVNGIVGHGEYGKGHGADPNGWWYPGDDGEWHHTYGIKANYFMYNTAQMLKRECPQMAKEVFK